MGLTVLFYRSRAGAVRKKWPKILPQCFFRKKLPQLKYRNKRNNFQKIAKITAITAINFSSPSWRLQHSPLSGLFSGLPKIVPIKLYPKIVPKNDPKNHKNNQKVPKITQHDQNGPKTT